MKKLHVLKTLFGLGLGAFLFLSYSSNPPNGHTGGPGEGTCANCHGGGSYNGTVSITGIPSTIQANTIYNVQITINASAGSPVAGGFQLMSLNGSNNNAGTLIVVNGAETGIDTEGGRTYMEHRVPKSFSGNSVTWNFDWQAPNGPNNEQITFYFVGNMVNLNNNTTGDMPVTGLFTGTVQGAADPLFVSVDYENDIDCFGGSNGSLTAFPTGGTPPYGYVWSNGMMGQTISGLPAGQYTVTVSDGAGMTATGSYTLEQPPALVVFEDNIDPFTCNAPAMVYLNASGGSPGYDFEWSTGANGQVSPVWPHQLPVSVTVTDAKNCTSIFIISTLPADTLSPVAQAQGGMLTCSVPAINLSSSGSDQGSCIAYEWSGPGGFSSFEANPLVNAPGDYTLTVTNICNGCSATAQTIVIEDKTLPTITINFPIDTFTCSVKLIEIDACFSQGTGYAWTTQNGIIAYGADSCVLGVNQPGDYTLIHSDPTNGCTSVTLVSVGGTGAPQITLDSLRNVRCNGGTDGYAAIAIHWGASPYTLLWPDSSMLLIRNDLAAGQYIITVTDDAQCQVVDTIMMSQPVPINLNLDVSHETAPDADDGMASVDPANGNPPYAILWSTGDSTNTISGLAPGSYSVTVTDSLGCSRNLSFFISPFGCSLEISADVTDVACHGEETGSITLHVTNPEGSYTISWDNGAAGNQLDQLTAGTYSVEVVDSLGCAAQGSYVINEPDAIVISLDSLNDASAPGNEDGAIFITIIGGTGSYAIEWYNDKGLLVGNTEDLIDVPSGVYEVCITDENDCTECSSYTIQANATEPVWMENVKLFPNPVRDWLTIQLPTNGLFNVQILSSIGQTYYQATQNGTVHIAADQWPTGMYVVRLIDIHGNTGSVRIVR